MKNGIIKRAKGFINSGLKSMRDWWRENRQRTARCIGRVVIFLVKTIIEVLLRKWL